MFLITFQFHFSFNFNKKKFNEISIWKINKTALDVAIEKSNIDIIKILLNRPEIRVNTVYVSN